MLYHYHIKALIFCFSFYIKVELYTEYKFTLHFDEKKFYNDPGSILKIGKQVQLTGF
jgi:hypothetical protein